MRRGRRRSRAPDGRRGSRAPAPAPARSPASTAPARRRRAAPVTIGPRRVTSTSSTTAAAPRTGIVSTIRSTGSGPSGPRAVPRSADELLPEEVGRVGAGGGDAPRGVAVEAGRKGRPADERRAGQLPVGRAQVGEVPRRRDGRCRGAGRWRGSVRPTPSAIRPRPTRSSRPPPPTRSRSSARSTASLATGSPARRARRRHDRQPRPVGRLDRRQRLRPVRLEDRQTRELGVPAAGQRQRLEAAEGEHVLDGPRARRPARSSTSSCGRGGIRRAALMPATYASSVASMSASSRSTCASATRRKPSVRDSRSIGSAAAPSSSASSPRPARASSSSWKARSCPWQKPEREPRVGVARPPRCAGSPIGRGRRRRRRGGRRRAPRRGSAAAAGRGRGAAFGCRAGRASAA